MKKMISCLLLLSLLFPLVSCGNEIAETTASSDTETTASTTESVESSSETTAFAETTETTETTNSDPVIPEIDPTTVFDETNIVFSFGAISDTHVNGDNTIPAQKFKSALEQLKAKAAENDADGIDAICVAGDLIDTGYNGNYNETTYFKKIYESVFDPTVTPLIYTVGNHDPMGWWTAKSASEAQKISKLLGDSYFGTDLDNEMRKTEECRHCKVGPYHFLCITPCTQDPVTYTAAAKEWLDKTLAELTAESPDQFVFVVTHPMIHNTVYGSDLGTYWYTSDLTGILEKYPQVVTLGGHLHFPLNDPRSVMQTAFTSFGCASVRYMAIEAGAYEDMAGTTTMNDKDEFSQGLLIQLDGNGNLRATRMDFFHEDTIDEPWEITHPMDDRSHLTKYTWDRGSEANNTPPTMSELSVTVGAGKGSTRPVTVTFTAAEDDEFAHHYEIVINGGNRETVKKILADFYRQPKSDDMKKVWTTSLGRLALGTYSISITAYDSWGKASNTVSADFEVSETASTTGETAKTELYADLDFVDGKITDKLGNVTVVVNNGTVEKKTVTLSGKTYEADAFVASAGHYAVCQFKNLSSASDVTAFAASGFTVEAFYCVSGTTGKVQGVFCGTQSGGWGIAEDASKKPYFITGSAEKGGYNTSVYASLPSSTTELVHVVGVYNAKTLTSTIFVNGQKQSSAEISATFKPGTGSAYNRFCLGDDITASGDGGDFPVSALTLVDAKIYTGALSEADVRTSYQTAVENLTK